MRDLDEIIAFQNESFRNIVDFRKIAKHYEN